MFLVINGDVKVVVKCKFVLIWKLMILDFEVKEGFNLIVMFLVVVGVGLIVVGVNYVVYLEWYWNLVKEV